MRKLKSLCPRTCKELSQNLGNLAPKSLPLTTHLHLLLNNRNLTTPPSVSYKCLSGYVNVALFP